jgi:hypothetical protein
MTIRHVIGLQLTATAVMAAAMLWLLLEMFA